VHESHLVRATFTDLNGDGRLDLIVAVPDQPDVLFVHDRWAARYPHFSIEGGRYGLHSNTHSQAFVSQEDGSWQRAPYFDLPFHHVHCRRSKIRRVTTTRAARPRTISGCALST